MQKWISRILTLVFFVNCFPSQTWAAKSRTSKNKHALEEKIAEKVLKTPYEEWEEEVEELKQVLKADDLTPDERKFAQLELDSAKLNIQHIQAFDNENYTNISDINSFFQSQINVLNVQKEDLEKKITLRSFYQTAQSDHMIAAAVYALHKHADDSKFRYKNAKLRSDQITGAFNRKYHADQELALRQAFLEQASQDYLTQQPSSLRVAKVQPLDRIVASPNAQSWILEAWANGRISPEELVEYADPVGDTTPADPKNIAAAAELLFYIFYGYNAPAEPLDPDTVANAVWMAKRLKYRAQHQLYVLEQKAKENQSSSLSYVQARGNLMRLSLQVKNLLAKHKQPADQAALQALDQQLPEFAALKKELMAYRQGVWSYSSVSTAITNDVLQALKENPKEDSQAATLLLQNLAYTTNFLIVMGRVGNIAEIVALLDNDKENFHGKNEQYINAVFGSIFDTMITYPLSTKKQQAVRQLLRCSAAPVCTYIDVKKTNAVNVRVQALAVGSMLRQVAKTNKIPMENPFDKPEEVSTTLSKDIFDDQTFRTEMAAYTIDIYGPTQRWNTTKIKRYGLNLDELQQISDYLARIFESYLPVPHPKTTYKTLRDGVYKKCIIREIDTAHSVPLKSLVSTSGIWKVSQSEDGYDCNDLLDVKRYGGLDHEIVTNSKGYLVGITRFNPFNRKQAFEDLTNKLLEEVAAWYLFGAAWKGMGYLWKGIRATTLAAGAATKASFGFKMARFNSKFSQVMKLSTNGWKTEMGLVNVVELKPTNTILIDMHRPGFQGIRMELSNSVLKGNSLKTLKGRILLRRALQSNIYASVGKNAQAMHIKAATKNANLLGTVTNDLANELSRPLSKLEQRVVKNEHSLVYATEQEIAQGNIVSQVHNVKGMPLSVYQPLNIQTPHIDLTTGLPEKFIINPLNGNVTGKLSGHYLGTITTPYTQDVLAYNIASGLTRAPSSKFLGNVLAYRYPIIPQIKGLTNFVSIMTAVDVPMNFLFVQPYMESFAKRQEEDLAKESGADLGKIKAQENSPTTLLGAVQGLQSKERNISGSTIQGVFWGINLGLNKILPNPIQTLRRSLFKITTDISTAIDDPIVNALGSQNTNILPLPGQMLSYPMMLMGDPTPVYTDAAKMQFSIAAKNQQVEHALTQHNLVSFQKQMDKEATTMEKDLPLFLEQNSLYLSALPKANKEMKRAYKTYIQAVKAARKKADTDLEQAYTDFEKCATKFLNTQADIMQRAVKAYIVQGRNQIPAFISKYRSAYKFLFTEQTEQEYTQFLTNYYTQKEKDLIAFFTAIKRAKESNQSPQKAQEEALNLLNQHEQAAENKRLHMDKELDKRVEVFNIIDAQWKTDYANIFPSLDGMILLPQEVQTQIRQISDDFISGIQLAYQNVTSSSALQKTYDTLLDACKQRFGTIKNYWINVNPAYEQVFNYTIGVAEEAAKQREADQESPQQEQTAQ